MHIKIEMYCMWHMLLQAKINVTHCKTNVTICKLSIVRCKPRYNNLKNHDLESNIFQRFRKSNRVNLDLPILGIGEPIGIWINLQNEFNSFWNGGGIDVWNLALSMNDNGDNSPQAKSQTLTLNAAGKQYVH